MLVDIIWPIAILIGVIVVSWFTYLTSDARKALNDRRADRAEKDAEHAHQLAMERERTMRAQTTYLWSNPDPPKDSDSG
jgi:hypothetical protein